MPGFAAAQPFASLFREHNAPALATLIRVLRDFDLAEDALQDAWVAAPSAWERSGVPANPTAWLVTAARRKAIDRLRRDALHARKLAEVARTMSASSEDAFPGDPPPIGDDRLRLIFTCCHPALRLEARVALTLRTLGGLTTAEIARAFIADEPTIAQRIVRAKRKIRDAAIPYRIPEAHELPERLPGVLAVLYLVFNEGYASTSSPGLLRAGLCAEAIRLARLLDNLMPAEPEVRGLLALMLLQDSRRFARQSGDGRLVLLQDQDRTLWDRTEIREGLELLEACARLRRPGSYQLQAAIAAVHASAAAPDATDWPRIAALYAELAAIQPSPVVELNRAVAIAMAEGPAAGLELIDAIAGLEDYHLYHAARADLCRRLGRTADAASAYRRALQLVTNPTERGFLQNRLDGLSESP